MPHSSLTPHTFIGLDEAGYGPNLGPLVVTATVWDLPAPPGDLDLWSAFAEILGRSPDPNGARLHVADSKRVYSAARGLAELERTVLCTLSLLGHRPQSFRELVRMLTEAGPLTHFAPRESRGAKYGDGCAPDGDSDDLLDAEPWFCGCELPLPYEQHPVAVDETGNRWRTCCQQQGIRLRTIRSDLVLTQRFNRLTREFGTKGAALSRISLNLLRQVWDPDDPQPALIVSDKHGGRNRYDHLLAETFDGPMVLRRQEGRELSSYRLGPADIRFQTRGESHLPVAVASLVSKYVRELAMILFNRFWCGRIDGLRPTAGYPVDAKRFHKEIAGVQKALAIDDEILWRER